MQIIYNAVAVFILAFTALTALSIIHSGAKLVNLMDPPLPHLICLIVIFAVLAHMIVGIGTLVITELTRIKIPVAGSYAVILAAVLFSRVISIKFFRRHNKHAYLKV